MPGNHWLKKYFSGHNPRAVRSRLEMPGESINNDTESHCVTSPRAFSRTRDIPMRSFASFIPLVLHLPPFP